MLQITSIRIDDKLEPTGIDTAPLITWSAIAATGSLQEQYRVTVWDGETMVVDSGITKETCQSWLLNAALRSLHCYRIRVWISTGQDEASAESTFTTGILDDQDWGSAQWITASATASEMAPTLRHTLTISAPIDRVLMVLAVAGCAAVHVNGIELEDKLIGAITDYAKRLQYSVLDLTSLVHDGDNEILVQVGKSFYGMTSPNIWNWEKAPWNAAPSIKAVVQTEYAATGTVRDFSGPSWAAGRGPTVYDDLYGGETYDARHEIQWGPAVVVTGPSGRLEAARQPPIRVSDTTRYRSATQVGTAWVIDYGKVLSGWVDLTVTAPRGHVVRMSYGEKLRDDGLPNNDDPLGYYAGRFQEDEYIAAGRDEPEEWHSQFTWKGFRYVCVEGWPGEDAPRPDQLVAAEVHTAVSIDGDFHCSSELLNRVHTITVQTMLNNLHGIPTDTPKYEKNGWTGDGMVATEMFLLNFGASQLLEKWVDDIADTASFDGTPKVIAPDGGWKFDWEPAPTWHSALILIPWWLYWSSGDTRVLSRNYDAITRYVATEFGRSADGVASTTLGDWVSPESSPGGDNPPEDLRVSATAFLYAMCVTTAKIARVLGHDADSTRFEELAERVRAGFMALFFDDALGIVRSASDESFRQSHQVLAIGVGILPEGSRSLAIDALISDIAHRDNHLNTGLLATKYLLPVLTESGHHDVAVGLALETTYPSWGFWVEQGATSTWEHWHPSSRSRNHYGLGTVDEWFYTHVLGVIPATAGFEKVRLTIRPVPALTWARGAIRTPRGTLHVDWRLRSTGVELDLEVPLGCEVTIEVDLSYLSGSESPRSVVVGAGRASLVLAPHETASPTRIVSEEIDAHYD